jgi:hypothetical protein
MSMGVPTAQLENDLVFKGVECHGPKPVDMGHDWSILINRFGLIRSIRVVCMDFKSFD